jgi:hypothetical protein
MAITTLAGLRAGLLPPEMYFKTPSSSESSGFFYSTMYTGGNPAAGAVPSPGMAGAALTSYDGQVPFNNPASGNAYLARLDGVAGSVAASQIFIANCVFDRLWHNSGTDVTNTSAQTVNSVTWPARDRNGSTDGDGVLIGLEWSTGSSNPPSVSISINYTNSAGTSGRTGLIASLPSNVVTGTFMLFSMDAGDVGVRSVQSITIGSSLFSGTVHLVAVRFICDCMQNAVASIPSMDALLTGLPLMHPDSVPFLAQVANSSNAGGGTLLNFAHG